LSKSLKGVRVLVTRPAHQADALCRLIEEAGGEAARLPMLSIEPAGDAAALSARLDAANSADGWIFTSGNAVRTVLSWKLATENWPPLFAIGPATAGVLEKAGHAGVVFPATGSSSEALLTVPQLQEAAGKRYAIITGKDGLSLLADTLSARGAEVETLEVYQRVPLQHDEARVEAEIAMADAIVISSGESLEQLWELTPESLHTLLRRRPLVLPSERVAGRARELGFETVEIVEHFGDEGWVEALVRMNSPTGVEPPPLEVPPRAQRKQERRTEPPPRPSPDHHDARQPSRLTSVLAWLLVVMLGGALFWAAWELRQQQDQDTAQISQLHQQLTDLQQRADDLESRNTQIAGRQTDLARVTQRNGLDISTMKSQMDESVDMLGRISTELQGGRERFRVAEVEQALLLANDRLLLAHDIDAALQALQVADDRLASLKDPKWFKVRETIAAERSALQAVPQPDLTSAALKLDAVIDRVTDLPLRNGLPVAPPRNLPDNDQADVAAHWYERLWHSVRAAIVSMFSIRRDPDATSLRLLPPEMQGATYNVLLLKLEAARVALLQRDTASFRGQLQSAEGWLMQQFDVRGTEAENMLDTVRQLQTLELKPSVPDISASLQMLRAQAEDTEQ